MVTHWGMSERLGPVAYHISEDHPFLGREIAQHERQFSEHTAQVIDEEVEKILHAAEDLAKRTLQQHAGKLSTLAEALLGARSARRTGNRRADRPERERSPRTVGERRAGAGGVGARVTVAEDTEKRRRGDKETRIQIVSFCTSSSYSVAQSLVDPRATRSFALSTSVRGYVTPFAAMRFVLPVERGPTHLVQNWLILHDAERGYAYSVSPNRARERAQFDEFTFVSALGEETLRSAAVRGRETRAQQVWLTAES